MNLNEHYIVYIPINIEQKLYKKKTVFVVYMLNTDLKDQQGIFFIVCKSINYIDIVLQKKSFVRIKPLQLHLNFFLGFH